MPRAKFVALSQYDIENKILDYYAREKDTPPGQLTRNTDLYARWNYNDTTWANDAPGISAEDWMLSLDVELERPDMQDNHTAAALASVIWSKVTKLVAVADVSTFPLSVQRSLALSIAAQAKKRTTKKGGTKKKTAKKHRS